MAVMKKKTPPEPSGFTSKAREDYDAVAAALRNDPGEWYLVHENTPTQARGRLPLRNRGCQTATRRSKKGKGWDVYAVFPAG